MSDTRPVGVFDSGIGGLTVFRECVRQLPFERFIYLADEGNAPWGPKSSDWLRARSEQVVRFLLGRDAKAIVVACNTMSVAALTHLRSCFDVPFIGIVPAVKPAAALTHTGTVGVLATHTTTTSESLAQLIRSFATGSKVLTQDCPELVTLVERGILDGPEVERVVGEELQPLLDAGIDVLVLGCTHLPFLGEAISRICGPTVKLLDPSEAVVRQLGRVLAQSDLYNPAGGGAPSYFTTGSPAEFRVRVVQLLGADEYEVESVDL